MCLQINERRFISGVVFYISPEGLMPWSPDSPDPQALVFLIHHNALAFRKDVSEIVIRAQSVQLCCFDHDVKILSDLDLCVI